MKGTIARMNELREVGYYRVFEIAEILKQTPKQIAKTIKSLKLVPFEEHFYSEYQIELIKNYH